MQKECKICGSIFESFGQGSHKKNICDKIHLYQCPECKNLYKIKKYKDFIKVRRKLSEFPFKILKINTNIIIFTAISNWKWDIVCRKCAEKNKEKVNLVEKSKRKQTNIKRYGVENPFQSTEIKNKIKNNRLKSTGYENPSQNPKIKQKKEETCYKNYGVKYPAQSKMILNKMNKTYKNKTGFDHPSKNPEVQELKKYNYKFKNGVENPAQNPEVQEKIKNTCIKKFGYPNAAQSPEIHKKIVKSSYKNGNRSSFEDLIIFELNNLNAIEGIHYFQEYKEKRYPFFCDFYFPKTDLFLEINGHWTHGKHHFDKNNIKDIKKLKLWKEKSKTSKFYKLAIDVWTKKDILKFNIAKKNNLNYLILWTKKDIEYWCNKYLELNI